MTASRRVRIKPTFDTTAWKYMRLSAILLIPMVWFHTIFTTLIVGAENTNLGLVAARWATVGWRVYDALLTGIRLLARRHRSQASTIRLHHQRNSKKSAQHPSTPVLDRAIRRWHDRNRWRRRKIINLYQGDATS